MHYDKIEAIVLKRNVNNIVVIKASGQDEDIKITFADNFERDVFCLLLRKLKDQFGKDPTRISEKEFFQKKE